ncbi:MAG: GGDEF domain-containing protein [Acidimicrobiales bacterium]
MTFGAVATQLRDVLGLARKLSTVKDEQELIELVCLTARELAPYAYCAVALRSDDGRFRFTAGSGFTRDQEARLRGLELSGAAFDALCGAAERRGPVYVVRGDHEVRDREDVCSGLLDTRPPATKGADHDPMIFVPLKGADGETCGFLNPAGPLFGETPGDEQALLLEALAELTVVGLEFLRSRTVERAASAVVEAQRRQLEALMIASAQVRGGLMLDDVLREIAVAMTSAGGFDRAAVYLLSDEDVLECRATVGLTPKEDAELRRNPFTLAEFAPAMLPQMQISRSYLFDHRRFDMPEELQSKLNVPDVEREWKDGQWHPEDMLTVPLTEKDGTLLGTISLDESSNGLLPDRAHIEALEFFADQCAMAVVHARRFEAVQAEAQTDPLTMLANRRVLEDVIELTLGRFERFGEPATLLFIDIDHFKEVNDGFGHAAGDLVLRRVAAALRERLRRGDLVARYGGEEFVALLPDTNLAAGSLLAESLRARVEALDLHDVCGDVPIRISVGVADVSSGRLDADSLLAAADAAMYRAKNLGRNRVFSTVG